MKNKIMWLIIGAVVFYFVWKKFLKKPEVSVVVNAEPVVVPSKVVSQGDVVNDLSFARGGY